MAILQEWQQNQELMFQQQQQQSWQQQMMQQQQVFAAMLDKLSTTVPAASSGENVANPKAAEARSSGPSISELVGKENASLEEWDRVGDNMKIAKPSDNHMAIYPEHT